MEISVRAYLDISSQAALQFAPPAQVEHFPIQPQICVKTAIFHANNVMAPRATIAHNVTAAISGN